MLSPVRHRLVRTHPGVRAEVAVPVVAHRRHRGLAGAGGARLHPRPDRARDAAQFVYAHVWRSRDLVMWDNRATMHRVRRFDDIANVRDMRRTTTRSDGPTTAQEAA